MSPRSWLSRPMWRRPVACELGRGRDSGYPLPPAQTRARAPNAHGSHLGNRHARPVWVRTHSRRTGVAEIVWHGVQHRPSARESPWPTAFPPCAPPTVPRPCSRTSQVLCSRSTPRHRAWRTYGSSPSPPGPPTATGGDGVSRFSRMEFLCMLGVFDSAGPRLARVIAMARCCLPCCLTPSAPRNARFRSSIPSLQIPLSNASSATLPPPSHGSGPGWFATPSLYDSFIRYSMPVYPGAIQAILPAAAFPGGP